MFVVVVEVLTNLLLLAFLSLEDLICLDQMIEFLEILARSFENRMLW